MNNVRTVSDTKRAFCNIHTRPINSIYRRVVEELMVEMHLLMVNVDFRYDPIYALGAVTTFDRFMQGYQPEQDQSAIFNAICQALETDPQQYRQDAQRLEELAARYPGEQLMTWLSDATEHEHSEPLAAQLRAIATNPQFKYSRLFTIGLLRVVEMAHPDLAQDEKQLMEALQTLSGLLHLPEVKVQRDIELYRTNLEKMTQARKAMDDLIKADRKKRDQQAAERDKDSPSNPPAPTEAST